MSLSETSLSMNKNTIRKDNRENLSMRPLSFEMDVSEYAEGSCIISYGKTKVLCTASIEERVPKWLQGGDTGWVTAEYSMLPRATHSRIRRDKAFSGGRSQEISRLVGRSLRACVDMTAIVEKSIVVDCDVLQADGGTRTASITGGFVALSRAFEFLKAQGAITKDPMLFQIAGLSSGFVNGNLLVDLDYEEDSSCDSDVNFVMNNKKQLIEVQGTAEGAPFSPKDFSDLVEKTQFAAEAIFQKQREALGLEKSLA